MPGSPIAILDSGVGGLTVARVLRADLPGENLIYFGDTARMPYGSKSRAAVTGFVTEAVDFLAEYQPKAVVLACNTATAFALPALRAAFPRLYITGVVDPGARAAAHAVTGMTNPRIGVLATEGTCRSGAYEKAIHRLRPDARVVLQPAPRLASLIEEGRDGSDPVVRLTLDAYLAPLRNAGVDAVVLGCTHYPLLRDAIQERLPGIAVVDGATRCGQDVARRLASHAFLAAPCAAIGRLECWVTDDSARFGRLASRFLGEEIPHVATVLPEELAARLSRRSSLRRAV